jgi:hypothetical protein
MAPLMAGCFDKLEASFTVLSFGLMKLDSTKKKPWQIC